MLSDMDPSSPQARERARQLNDRGCARWRQGELDAALADLTEAARLDPAFALARNNLACVRAAGGDAAGAVEDLTAALRLDPRLATASGNLRLLSGLVEGGPGAAQATTISAAIRAADGKGFCEGLIDFLQANVPVARGFEDCRDDAIADVVARVLSTADEADVPLAESLRMLRRTTTRGWVSSLVSVYRRRGGGDAATDGAAARPAPPDSGAAPPAALAVRLEEVLERRLEQFIEASRPSVRARRRVVWTVFVGSLRGGVRLSRKEVLASVRAMGISRRKASDAQLLGDLDRIVQQLKAAREGL